ncbi:MAG: hypothetical protein ABFR32_02270 [Bacteroidota bacterium]
MINLVVIKSENTIIEPSILIINFNKIIRFIKVGKYLHLSAFIGIFLFFFSISKITNMIRLQEGILGIIPWVLFLFMGLSLFIIAELDVRGRYQNYKQVKEKLYKYGYDERIIRLYMHSNCQRDAARVAGKDLNHKRKINKYFYKIGYRWYHILPDAFVNNPFIIFRKQFWTKILFTEYYQLQNFYW